MTGSRCASFVTLACLIALLFGTATAQSYPNKPVRFVLPSGAGGSDDFHARLMSRRFTELPGQQFIVDNRPGAGRELERKSI